VAQQTRRLLQQAGTLRTEGCGELRLLGSGAPGSLDAAAARWLTATA